MVLGIRRAVAPGTEADTLITQCVLSGTGPESLLRGPLTVLASSLLKPSLQIHSAVLETERVAAVKTVVI